MSQYMLSRYSEGTLLLAEQIANTLDTTRPEPEYLRTPADLERYLRSWNVTVSARPTDTDLADVLALRQRIRAVFAAPDLPFRRGGYDHRHFSAG